MSLDLEELQHPVDWKTLAEKLQRMKKITAEKLERELWNQSHVALTWDEFQEIKRLILDFEANGWSAIKAIKKLGKSDEYFSPTKMTKATHELETALDQIKETIEKIRDWLEKIRERIEGVRECLISAQQMQKTGESE